MKKILYLSFYFEPDLCAGSFRNTPLAKELAKQVKGKATIDIITTLPNRYSTFEADALEYEEFENYTIKRIVISKHKSGMQDQVLSFNTFYKSVKKIVKDKKYDLVLASSSRLFTAYLGYAIAKKLRVPLYLDIRDIFIDTMKDVLSSKVLKALTLPTLSIIERKVFNYATHINLISGGFQSYFNKFTCKNYTSYPNGIDDIFLNLPKSETSNNGPKLITYAGNFGEGQGLHKIIPQAAKLLGNDYQFLLIGDGGAKQKLVDQINKEGVKNVKIVDPMPRKQLLASYAKSDFLFIHLNDYDAFKKVLPSKVFELGAYDKPIIAGVAGFANAFIEKEIKNKILFLPGDVTAMVEQLTHYAYKNEVRTAFIQKYKRENINRDMAASIVNYL